MKLKIKDAPVLWMFWHPHQGYWNWDLCRVINKVIFIRPLSRLAIKGVINFDTSMLARKLRSKKTNANKSGYSPEKTINYFDLGTHKNAAELRWTYDELLSKLPNPYKIYAVEANPVSFNQAV